MKMPWVCRSEVMTRGLLWGVNEDSGLGQLRRGAAAALLARRQQEQKTTLQLLTMERSKM